MIEFKDPVAERIKAFILDETALLIDNRDYLSDPVWHELKERGSSVWLQGCERLATEIWSEEMDAVCSDTRLLGAAVKRGELDSLIEEANIFLKGLPRTERVAEIAFILNARRAVKLSKQFAAKVSVEVPPLPGGVAEMQQYGQRLFQVCPEHILISLPFCEEGLEAAAALGKAGVPVTVNNQYDLDQTLTTLRRAAPAYVSIRFSPDDDPDNSSAVTSGAAERLLRFFAEHPHRLNGAGLIADGLNDSAAVERMKGFPILRLSPDTARAYHRLKTGAWPGPANESPAPSPAADADAAAIPDRQPEIAHRLAAASVARRRREYTVLTGSIADSVGLN